MSIPIIHEKSLQVKDRAASEPCLLFLLAKEEKEAKRRMTKGAVKQRLLLFLG
jgi:hypothetical protein